MWLKLKKYAWAIGLGAVVVSSFVSAYATNRFVARLLKAPEPVQGLPKPGAGKARQRPAETVASSGAKAPELAGPEAKTPEAVAAAPGAVTPTPSPSGEPAADAVVSQASVRLEEYQVILDRNLFDSSKSAGTLLPQTATEGGEPGVAPPAPLNIRLLGTVVASPAQYSWAIISKNEGNAVQEVFRLEDDLYGMGSLRRISRNQIVVLLPDGTERVVDLFTGENAAQPVASAATSTPGALGESIKKIGENRFELDSRELQTAMDNMDKLTQGARVVPSFENGTQNGFKIFRIKPDSVYGKLGMRNGDIIHRINGAELTNMERALQMYQTLRSEKSFTIDITRRGQKQTMEYVIR